VHQEGAELGSRCAGGHGALCPVLATRFLLVREVLVVGVRLLHRCCQ